MVPVKRFQHSMVIFKQIMIIVGGRNFKQENLPFDILNLRTLRWSTLPGLDRFRHVSWCYHGVLYTFGGFESHNPNIPTKSLKKREILKLLEPLPILKKQIASLGVTGDQKMGTSLHQSMYTKYDLNENVVVARTHIPNMVKFYPLNSLQREAGKIKSRDNS